MNSLLIKLLTITEFGCMLEKHKMIGVKYGLPHSMVLEDVNDRFHGVSDDELAAKLAGK